MCRVTQTEHFVALRLETDALQLPTDVDGGCLCLALSDAGIRLEESN